MDKINWWIELFYKLLKIIKVFFIKVKLFLKKTYANFVFIFNKQETIKRMYAPIIKEKTDYNKGLERQLSLLKESDTLIIKEIHEYTKENSALSLKIEMLQSLILDNSKD